MKRNKLALVATMAPVSPADHPLTMDEKLTAALAYLDRKWVHHPQFVGKKNLQTGYLNKWRAKQMSGRGVTITTKEKGV